jgi:hypothetical protein
MIADRHATLGTANPTRWSRLGFGMFMVLEDSRVRATKNSQPALATRPFAPAAAAAARFGTGVSGRDS